MAERADAPGLSLDASGNLVENAPESGVPDQAEASVGQASEHPTEESFLAPGETVPPGQERAYKQMQASYTRKMQELSERLRAAKEVESKARMFDEAAPVLTDPEFQRIVAAYKDGRLSQVSRPEEEDEPELDPAVKSWLEKRLSSQEEARRLQDIRLHRQLELRDLMSQYDDVRDHFPGMVAVVKADPNISLENAYRVAKFPSLANLLAQVLKENEVLKAGKRQQMSVSPGVRAGASTEKTTMPKDLFEAAQRAIDKLSKGGVNLKELG